MPTVKELLREYEGRIGRIVRASRIFPELLAYGEEPARRLRVLRRLVELGLGESVVEDVVETYIQVDGRLVSLEREHPWPMELVELASTIREAGETRVAVFMDRERVDRAYIQITGVGYLRVDGVRWPDPLGEPDTEYNGLPAYSHERFRKYLSWCLDYIRRVYPRLGLDVEGAVREAERLAKGMGEVEAYVLVEEGVETTPYRDGYRVVASEELRERGVKVVRYTLAREGWLLRRGGRPILPVVRREVAETLDREYWERERRREERSRRLEETLKEAFQRGRISDRLSKATLRDIKEILVLRDGEEAGRLMEAVRQVCEEEAILHNITPPYWRKSYVDAGLSPHYPLRTLYALYRLREMGVPASLAKKASPEPAPSLLIKVATIYSRGLDVEVLARPRRDLKVEYPHEARMEDGCVVIVARR